MSAKKAAKSRLKRKAAAAAESKSIRSTELRGKASRQLRREPRLVGGKPLSPLEVQLRKTLAEMGLARARRVFAAVEASFDD